MDVSNRHDFLAWLDQIRDYDESGVFGHAAQHVCSAIDEVGFSEFGGTLTEVLRRLSASLRDRGSETALWVMVFSDLCWCTNFGGAHWFELVRSNPDNVRFALQGAEWVYSRSGADGGRALAALLDHFQCWEIAEQHVVGELRDWWRVFVLPRRSPNHPT